MNGHPMYRPRPADAVRCVRAGVGVLIRDEHGRVLLERRSDCGLWGLPGGKIEPGESVLETALREVREETGLTVRIRGLRGVYSNPANHTVTFPDNVVQLMDVILDAEVVSGLLKRSCESEELRFFAIADLPHDVAAPAQPILADLAAGRQSVVE